MQLPLPVAPTSHLGAAAAGPAMAMPPTPPEMLSRTAGRDGRVGWQSQQAHAGGAVGVAWLGVGEKSGTSANAGGTTAAAAAAAAGDMLAKP